MFVKPFLWVAPFLMSTIAAHSLDFDACNDLLDISKYEKEASFAPFRFDPRDGVLFRNQDFILDYKIDENNLAYFLKIGEALRDQNITLAMMIAPPRGLLFGPDIAQRLLPESIEFDYSLALQSFTITLDSLSGAGIAAPNIVEFTTEREKSSNFYFNGNSHWTPNGAIEAALAVRKELENKFLVSFEQLNEVFTISGSLEISDVGNLMRTASQVCGVEPVTETVDTEVVERVVAQDEAISTTLFGDTTEDHSRVALLGTSFSNGNLRDQFKATPAFEYAMQGSILNRSVHAGGPISAMESFFTSQDRPDVEIVVWEMKPDHLLKLSTSDLAQVLGAVLPVCEDSPLTRSVETEISGGSWVTIGEYVILQDLLNITLPLGHTEILEVRVTSLSGETQSFRLDKSKRIPDDWLSGLWTLFLGDPQEPAGPKNPYTIEVRTPQGTAPALMNAKICTTAF